MFFQQASVGGALHFFSETEGGSTKARDEDNNNNATGGREEVKSGGCVVPGTMDGSGSDDGEDVDADNDAAERSVSELLDCMFVKQSFWT